MGENFCQLLKMLIISALIDNAVKIYLLENS